METEVQIPARPVKLEGCLNVPLNPRGLVLFAHGSGSSRHSKRNQFVAQFLQQAGLATLLFDLLTRGEEERDAHTGHLRFDIKLLAERLILATEWITGELAMLKDLKVGYFGSSTGGGAALVAAAQESSIAAVVSRGGRPDLATASLSQVQVPTLLIVGGRDEPVIRLNEEAMAQMHCEVKLQIVPGATHLFEEPGALENVAELAQNWFTEHLAVGQQQPSF